MTANGNFSAYGCPPTGRNFVTNEAEPRDTAAAEQESSARWTIEPFHRERRQLTGVQACQCRLARSQRNYIGLAVRA